MQHNSPPQDVRASRRQSLKTSEPQMSGTLDVRVSWTKGEGECTLCLPVALTVQYRRLPKYMKDCGRLGDDCIQHLLVVLSKQCNHMPQNMSDLEMARKDLSCANASVLLSTLIANSHDDKTHLNHSEVTQMSRLRYNNLSRPFDRERQSCRTPVPAWLIKILHKCSESFACN